MRRTPIGYPCFRKSPGPELEFGRQGYTGFDSALSMLLAGLLPLLACECDLPHCDGCASAGVFPGAFVWPTTNLWGVESEHLDRQNLREPDDRLGKGEGHCRASCICGQLVSDGGSLGSNILREAGQSSRHSQPASRNPAPRNRSPNPKPSTLNLRVVARLVGRWQKTLTPSRRRKAQPRTPMGVSGNLPSTLF